MGGSTFTHTGHGKTAREAFASAREEALYDHGHAGYSGTLAEKDSFVEIKLPEDMDAKEYAYKLIEDDDKRICDKWGDAGCIKTGDEEYLFFGWASS